MDETITVEKYSTDFHTSWSISIPGLDRVVVVRSDKWRNEVSINWSGCGDRNLETTTQFFMAILKAIEIAKEEGA